MAAARFLVEDVQGEGPLPPDFDEKPRKARSLYLSRSRLKQVRSFFFCDQPGLVLRSTNAVAFTSTFSSAFV